MTDRDRLKELFEAVEKDPAITCPHYKTDKTCDTCKYTINNFMCNHTERTVDYLLANGVFILPEDLRGTEDFSISAFIEAMQMYKEKDRYIKLPCKVGDVVYQIKYCRCGNPECFEMKHCYKKDTKRTPKVIDSIMISQKGKRLTAPSKFEWKPIGTICYKIIQKPFKLEWLTEVGKTVFLTKEEAEQALEGMNNA